MGHGTNDKLFITPSEHSGVYGQHGATVGANLARRGEATTERLPFDCCSLSLQPWIHPVCSREDGTIFELTNIIPYLAKYGVNPVTGTPLAASQLLRLHFAQDENEGGGGGGGTATAPRSYHDPVSFKPFNRHTHLVALAPTGNVYAWETVETLNLRAKNLRDLLDDTPFKRSDVITLQDPLRPEARHISSMHHVKNQHRVTAAERRALAGAGGSGGGGGEDEEQEVNAAATGSAAKLIRGLRDRKSGSAASTGLDGEGMPDEGEGSGAREGTSQGKRDDAHEANGTRAPPDGGVATGRGATTTTNSQPAAAGQPPGARGAKSSGWLGASFTSTALTPRTAVDLQQTTTAAQGDGAKGKRRQEAGGGAGGAGEGEGEAAADAGAGADATGAGADVVAGGKRKKLRPDEMSAEELARRAKRREFRETDRTTWFGTRLEDRADAGAPRGSASTAAAAQRRQESKAVRTLLSSSTSIGKYLASSSPSPRSSLPSSSTAAAPPFSDDVSTTAKPRAKAKTGFGDFSAW